MSDYLTSAESEFMQLSSWLKNHAQQHKAKGFQFNKTEQAFIDTIADMRIKAEEYAEKRHREEEEEKREKEQEEKVARNTVEEPCPRCKQLTHSKVTGTTTNDLGHTIRRLKCSKCHVVYTDPHPIDFDEHVAWTKNFLKNLTKKNKDGESYVEKLNIPKEEIQDLRKKLKAMIEADKQEKIAFKKIADNEKAMQDIIKRTNASILKVRMHTQNWGNSAGMA